MLGLRTFGRETGRGRMRHRRPDDSGSTLVAVLIVMLVLTVGALALSAILLGTTSSLAESGSRAKAQAAVDGGMAAQTARLKSGGLVCGSNSTQPLSEGAFTSYSYSLNCGAGVATLTVRSTVAGVAAARNAVFKIIEAKEPPTAGGPGLFYTYGLNTRLNSYVFDDVNSEVGIDEFVGSAGVYASTGNIACGTGSVFPGDIYTKTGALQLDTGCTVKGNAYIGDKADINDGTIEGSLIAPKNVNHEIKSKIGVSVGNGGDVYLGGTFTINGGTVYGSIEAAGSGSNTLGSGTVYGNLRYRGTYGIWGTPARTIVKGSLVRDTAMTAQALPVIPDWQDVGFVAVNATTPPQAWTDAGYKLTTVTGPACSKWSGNSADVTSLAGALPSRMIFDIRGCSGGFDTNAGGANKTVTINRDIAVIANSWYLSGTKFKSQDGQPHTVFLITPDGQPTVAGPQCNSPAKASEQLNDSTVDPKIAVYIYTPCLMKFNSGTATFRGQVYSGQLEFGGGVKVAFAPRNIPGKDFGAGIDTPGAGGEGDESTFELLSVHDIEPSP